MRYKIILILLLAFAMGSCDSLLDVEPRQSVDASGALTTLEGVNSNLANIYSNFKNVLMYGRDFVATSEALADNARIINRAGGRYQNQGTNAPNSHFGSWALAYSTINEINLLLAALPSANISDSYRNEVEGQLRGIRALLYFDLIRAYAYEPGMAPSVEQDKGGVPLVLSGVLSEDQITLPSRATTAEVYAQIYLDLTAASTLAPTTGSPAYITQAAVHAIFAKVALYNKDWAKAESEATACLATTTASLSSNANYVSDWRAASHRESIFEILFKTSGENIGVNESIQSAFTTLVTIGSTTLGGYGAVVPTTAFLNLVPQATDVRRGLYLTGVSRSNTIATECTKFLGKTGTLYMDNIPVIRISEVYLIRAEARAQLGTNDQGSMDDLNLISTRGSVINAGLTGAALIGAIINERRIELAFEGDRWFDLKRRGADVIKSTGNVLYDDYRILAPLPIRETQSNPNLAQNFNY